jgi:hypothetical protein
MCGCVIRGDVYAVLRIGDKLGHLEFEGGELIADAGGSSVMHKSCALYSVTTCPFLKYPTSRRRKIKQGAYRGPDTEIVGFRRYGLYFGGGARSTEHPWQEWKLGSMGRVERIPVTNARAMRPLYEAVADSPIDVTTQLHWRWDDEADMRALKACWAHDSWRVLTMRSRAITLVNGRVHPLALID